MIAQAKFYLPQPFASSSTSGPVSSPSDDMILSKSGLIFLPASSSCLEISSTFFWSSLFARRGGLLVELHDLAELRQLRLVALDGVDELLHVGLARGRRRLLIRGKSGGSEGSNYRNRGHERRFHKGLLDRLALAPRRRSSGYMLTPKPGFSSRPSHKVVNGGNFATTHMKYYQ